MQKSLKIVSIVLFSLIFCLALFFAFNATSEIKVLAESAPSIQINGTEYVDGVDTNPLQTAINSVPANTPTEIHLSGEIVLNKTITIQGTSGQVKQIKFVAVADTTIIRNEANTEFIMFKLGEHCTISFETINATLTIDGNRQDADKKDKVVASIFSLEQSNLTLSGEIYLVNNTSYSGSCIKTSTSSTLICAGATFKDNKSCNQGGAIELKGGEASFKNCKFTNNFSGLRGGAIFNSGANLLIEQCDFESNGLLGMEHSQNTTINGIHYDGVVYGGALSIENGETTISGGTFQNSYARNEDYPDDVVGRGGAIEIRKGELSINGTTFSGNTAYLGGAIAVVGGELTVNDFEVSGNSANQLGGGVFLDGGDLTINGGTISGNSAKYGGAIAVLGGKLTVNNFTVSGNTATQEGGGLYLKSGTVEINGGTIKNNTTSANKAQDVAWLISDSGNDYLSNNIFSAKVENENNNYVIYSESDFPVGENFELGKNNYVNLLADKTIYVKANLTPNGEKKTILINVVLAENSEDEQPVVYFINKEAMVGAENVFDLQNAKFNLFPNTNKLYLHAKPISVVQFFKYYDEETKTLQGLMPVVKDGQELDEQEVLYTNSAIVPNTDLGGGVYVVGWVARKFGNLDIVLEMTPGSIEESVVFVAILGFEIDVQFMAGDEVLGTISTMKSNEIIDEQTLQGYIDLVWANHNNKTGHTFAGTFSYYNAETNEKEGVYNLGDRLIAVDEHPEDGVKTTITLKADYDKNKYTVVFKGAGENGEILKTFENVVYEDTLGLSQEKLEELEELLPGIKGYDDKKPCWTYENTDIVFDPGSSIITGDTTLVATYFKNKYDITFVVKYISSTNVIERDEEDDEELASIKVEYLGSATLPTPTRLDGFDGEIVWDYDGAPIESNLIITGEVYINKYTVSFIANGKILDSYEKEHFETLTEIPEIPEEDGYTILGWDKDTSSEIKSNINFEAEYRLKVYTITFVLPDGTKIDRTVKHGHTVDNSNIIDIGFGEIVKYDKPLENITADGEIRVTTINLFMWIMIGVGVIVLAVSAFMIYKLVKRRRVIAEARKRHRHIGPYVTGDDEFN